jgi:hypothetical protein
MTKMIKFSDSLHEMSEDGFKVETDYRNRTFIRVYQETESENVIEVFLSKQDIEQIYHSIQKEMVK